MIKQKNRQKQRKHKRKETNKRKQSETQQKQIIIKINNQPDSTMEDYILFQF